MKKNSHKINLIIFDFDGTLVRSLKYWEKIFDEDISKKYNIENRITKFKNIFCASDEQMIDIIFEKNGVKANKKEAVNFLMERIKFYYENNIKLVLGAKSFLKTMHKKGYKICIATATKKESILDSLKKFGIDSFIDYTTCTQDIGKTKEFPDVYVDCSKKFGEKPENCIVFEDSLTGLKTAQKAGFFTCGVEDYYQKANKKQIKRISNVYIKNYGLFELLKLKNILK